MDVAPIVTSITDGGASLVLVLGAIVTATASLWVGKKVIGLIK
jgi:hypothetical protein